jgi:hypothetical protein
MVVGSDLFIDIIIEKYKKEPEKRNNLKEDKEIYRHIAAHMAQSHTTIIRSAI